MRFRLPAAIGATALVAAAVPAVALTHTAATTSGPLGLARDAAPVVLTGAQIPQWAAPAVEGLAKTYPSGTNQEAGSSEPKQFYDPARTAHNGTIFTVPPTPPNVTPIHPDDVAAYAWTGGGWKEIPVQIDQRFPYFLANGHSGFSFYSGTDEELTYSWAPDGHDIGEEAWKKMFGDCTSRFAADVDEVNKAIAAGWVSLGPGETADDYVGPASHASMQDPQPLFDTDDELSFMAGDAGAQAPVGTALPTGTSNGQVVTVTDPLDPGAARYVYLVTQPGGSSFSAANGYVTMQRDSDSLTWLDKDSFAKGAYDGIGVHNGGYGPNLPGTVCRTAPGNPDGLTTADGVARASSDRQPRDDFTITTPTYTEHATGRWLVQGYQVRKPGGGWTPNIIARWKGRAFQQSPDASVSVVGFEDEQVNWELNSALLGWRSGPVRAIREVWGADSGTNVTKTETYYSDADTYAYHLRVHPIPPDGLYTDWSYRPGVATRYYNVVQQAGVPIDGQPDTSLNEIDQVPVTGQNVYVNSCDPKFTLCSAMNNPEEVAGDGFGLVYQFELTGPTAAAGNAAVVPYYRDDACFDDGTGDAPAPRPYPGDASTSNDVRNGYVAYWQQYRANHPQWQRFPAPTSYADLKCQPQLAVNGDPTRNPTTPPWQIMPFAGAIGEHGVHFFATQDSDNATLPKNVDEVDGQQWRFAVPMNKPTNVLVPYGANVSAKLVPVVAPYAG